MFFNSNKLGKDFKYEIVSVPDKTGELIYWHDTSATIKVEVNEEETLEKAWQLVVKLAKKLKAKIIKKPEVKSFRIIVGWSKETRERQGQIFKIWQPNKNLDLIINCKSLSEYQKVTEDKHYVPFKGWQRDVFKD